MKLASLLLALGLAAGAVRAGIPFLGDADDAGRREHTSHHASGAQEEWAEYEGLLRHGACKRWYPDGTLKAEGRYEAGRMHGEWTWYAADGSLDAARSGRYEHGSRVSN